MKRHDLDTVSLLGGLLFLSLGVAFLFDALNAWSADVTWVPPIVLIVLGFGGVLSTIGKRGTVETTEAAPAPDVTSAVGDTEASHH